MIGCLHYDKPALHPMQHSLSLYNCMQWGVFGLIVYLFSSLETVFGCLHGVGCSHLFVTVVGLNSITSFLLQPLSPSSFLPFYVIQHELHHCHLRPTKSKAAGLVLLLSLPLLLITNRLLGKHRCEHWSQVAGTGMTLTSRTLMSGKLGDEEWGYQPLRWRSWEMSLT